MCEILNYTSKQVQRERTRWPAKDTVGDLGVWLEGAPSSLMTSVTLADILVDYNWALVVSQIQWMISFSATLSTTTKFSFCLHQPPHADYSQLGRVPSQEIRKEKVLVVSLKKKMQGKKICSSLLSCSLFLIPAPTNLPLKVLQQLAAPGSPSLLAGIHWWCIFIYLARFLISFLFK